MRKTIKLQVLMAGQYSIPKGKKVTFTFQKEKMVYYAESDGKVFGLAQFLKKGRPSQLEQLGTCFCGSVVKSQPLKRRIIVKIPIEGGKTDMKWEKEKNMQDIFA